MGLVAQKSPQEIETKPQKNVMSRTLGKEGMVIHQYAIWDEQP
jgi:hypothetical protein